MIIQSAIFTYELLICKKTFRVFKMVHCCIIGCTSFTGRREPGISFHRFPKDSEKIKIWIANIKMDDWEPSKNYRICSKHFESHWFYKTDSNLKTYLLNKAVPTIFPELPSHSKLIKATKRPSTLSQANAVEKILRKKLLIADMQSRKKSKKIKALKQSLRRQRRQIVRFEDLISNLKKENSKTFIELLANLKEENSISPEAAEP